MNANTVIGDQWRGGGATTGSGGDDDGKKSGGRIRYEMLTEMPAEYAGTKCAAKGCDKPVDFNTAKNIISSMKSKNKPMDGHDVICKGCNKKLKDPNIQCSDITTESGRVLPTSLL